jgi:hemolysin III
MPDSKPLLRGYLHQEAFFMSLGACILLVAKSSNEISLVASGIYSFGLLLMFGISAIYHRPYWESHRRAMLKRFDLSAIFILIAATFTPVCLLALPEKVGYQLLLVIWIAAVLGILKSFIWTKAPKWLTSFFYVVVGWLALPYMNDLYLALGFMNVFYLALGGVVYTAGAVFYALKKPNFVPGVFGYHELFHLLTIFGAAFHFVVVYQLIH